MGSAVIRQGYQHRISLERLAADLDAGNTAADSVGILDSDLIARGVVAKDDFEVPPGLRDTRINQQSRAAQTKSQYPFETRPIHPSRRAGVPGPAAASHMRRL